MELNDGLNLLTVADTSHTTSINVITLFPNSFPLNYFTTPHLFCSRRFHIQLYINSRFTYLLTMVECPAAISCSRLQPQSSVTPCLSMSSHHQSPSIYLNVSRTAEDILLTQP